MSALNSKLAALKDDPKAADAYLSQVWNKFHNSEPHDALLLVTRQIIADAETALFSLDSNATARAFAAGQVTSMRRLLVTLRACFDFDPEKADYSNPDLTESIPQDTDQLI